MKPPQTKHKTAVCGSGISAMSWNSNLPVEWYINMCIFI